jgi:3-oxoacyl-[acyl-carrier protein] reductase
MQQYASKTVLVTGSTRGVGRFVCEHFLKHGATVIGFARGEAAIVHSDYHHFRVDVADSAAVQKIFGDIRNEFKALEVVINAAAVLTSQYSMIMPTSAVQDMLQVNLFGPFIVSREAAKLMRTKKWGRIINIGSMASSLEPVGDSIYAATKSGLITLSNVMARELAGFNVTCNTLAISAIESDMLKQLPRQKIDEIIARLPLPRYSTEDDILNVVDFFVSERSSYITAQTIFLGGVN